MIKDTVIIAQKGMLINVENTGLDTLPNAIDLKIWSSGCHPTVALTVMFHGDFILTPSLNEEFVGCVLDNSRPYPIIIRCWKRRKMIEERKYVLPPMVREEMWKALTIQNRANKGQDELLKVGWARMVGADGEPDLLYMVPASEDTNDQ